MNGKLLVGLLSITLLAAGCTAPAPSNKPVRAAGAAAQPQSNKATGGTTSNTLPTRNQRPACATPAGWYAYQVQMNETVYSIAARAGIGAADLLTVNCLTAPGDVQDGLWLRVPPQMVAAAPQTLLPLGISALVADPLVVPAGGMVNISWQGQGPVIGVRFGWLYNNQFIEEAANLPVVGSWPFVVPSDGRDSITLVVRVSDGLQEISAQTTVHILCPENWFFSPSPAGCPTPILSTTFREQHFERGTIVYLSTLRASYALINGRVPLKIEDHFTPGMPLKDPALDAAIPAGLMQPSGPIYYAWRGVDGLPAALGYAIDRETAYYGLMQETVSAVGDTIYLLNSSGQIYVLPSSAPWGVIAVQ